MKRLLPILFLLLAGCVEGEAEFIPSMDRTLFKEALKRSLLIEARVNKERVDLKHEKIPIDAYYSAMYEELGITKEEYVTTFTEFTQHPLQFEDLFEEVANELQLGADSLQNLLN